MKGKPDTALDVNGYIQQFPEEISEKLRLMRNLIRKAAPNAEEYISYGMPAYKLNGILVYFAAFKNHIGLYATPSGHSAFENELSKYKSGKGSVQFPHDQPLPQGLISKIVKFRVKENTERLNVKKKK